ncbi:MAG: hypothetical protein M1829_006236 [Trizodia sp. TS-e1964]|nr:MAG: hypothetical protein M1829_006236 [Trizodia sp. TS-e1964]
MFPPIDTQTLQQNPKFEQLYNQLKESALNNDGSSKSRNLQKVQETNRAELQAVQIAAAKLAILRTYLPFVIGKSKDLPDELQEVIEIIAIQLNSPLSIGDRELLLPDVEYFLTYIQAVGKAVSSLLLEKSIQLARVAHPESSPSTLRNLVPSLPRTIAHLQTSLQSTSETLSTARLTLTSLVCIVLTYHRRVLELAIQVLESSKHGSAVRGLKAESDKMALFAETLGTKLTVQLHNTLQEVYAPAVADALRGYSTHLRDSLMRVVQREKSVREELGAYERGGKDLEVIASRYAELGKEVEGVMEDIERLKAALAAAQRPAGAPAASLGAQPLGNLHPPLQQAGTGGYQLPQPTNSGSLDLSSIKPVTSGTVSIAEAIQKAKGIAAEKGFVFDGRNAIAPPNRDSDARSSGRVYRRSRSRSRSPPRRENFRDNYNSYRDERRDDRRGPPRDFARDRSFSPGLKDHRGGASRPFSPANRQFPGAPERPPAGPVRTENREGENVETIQIESNLVGLIIGRQGENLRRVESETGCRVQFITGPEQLGPTRSCKITGPPAARLSAKQEIYRIIDENNPPARGAPPPDRAGPGPANLGVNYQPPLRDGEDSTQIMVPDRTVGLIIGRGGETIRDLQERSGCHVNIVGEQKSMNGLRPVNLIGTPQAAAMAKELIMEIVDSDTKNLAGQAPAQARGGAYGAAPGNGADRVSDSIMVPSDAVGMIIGKGGETIKDMQNTTGCKINVSSQTGPQEVEREIGLIGSRESIDRAKTAIMDKVDAVQQKNGGHRGGMNRHNNNDTYNDRYSHSQQPQKQAPTGSQSAGGQNSQAQPVVPPTGEADPYAAYGGYNAYVALWYQAAMAQQQGQAQNEQPGPPGTK